MTLIFSALGFGIIIGPILDAYSGVYGMVRSMFFRAI